MVIVGTATNTNAVTADTKGTGITEVKGTLVGMLEERMQRLTTHRATTRRATTIPPHITNHPLSPITLGKLRCTSARR